MRYRTARHTDDRPVQIRNGYMAPIGAGHGRHCLGRLVLPHSFPRKAVCPTAPPTALKYPDCHFGAPQRNTMTYLSDRPCTRHRIDPRLSSGTGVAAGLGREATRPRLASSIRRCRQDRCPRGADVPGATAGVLPVARRQNSGAAGARILTDARRCSAVLRNRRVASAFACPCRLKSVALCRRIN